MEEEGIPDVPEGPTRLEQWAQAIKEFEGWFEPGMSPKYPKGSVSFRNLNPGNVRQGKGQKGVRSGFAFFETYEDGWNALLHQLRIAATGTSKVYRPDMTLLQFFQTYAPSSDGNYPQQYANYVAKQLKVYPSIKIQELA